MNRDFFVQNVKHLCNIRGIPPTAAFRECGIGKSFLNDFERGQTPSVEKVQRLAHYLGCTTSELLGETSPNPTALSDLDADTIAVAEAYAQADEKSRAMVRLALNLDMDVPLAAHGGPSGKISAKTAEALEKGAVEFTGDI